MLFLCILSSVFVSVFGAVATSHGHVQQSPAFCHGLDCPRYTVTQTFKGYELRKYEETKWVATNMTTMEYTDDDQRMQFFKLFYYISGNNTAHMKIPMTAPVVKTIIHGAGPACEATFIEHFMIPHNMQSNTPEPTDSKTYLVTMKSMSFYVKSFPGRPSQTDKIMKVDELAQEIGDPSKYDQTKYFLAGYDDPYAVNRHNEVWLLAMN